MLALKKNLFSIGLAFSVILGVAFSFVPQEVEAHVRMESVGNSCTSEEIDCHGWGTGDRTICHVNGDGVPCTCGDFTKCE